METPIADHAGYCPRDALFAAYHSSHHSQRSTVSQCLCKISIFQDFLSLSDSSGCSAYPKIVSLDENAQVRAKVADFGLSRIVTNQRVTGSLATWQWLPPEVIDDVSASAGYDVSADIYSFAMICCELVTLLVPFDEFIDNVCC